MKTITLTERTPEDPYKIMDDISENPNWHQDPDEPTVIRGSRDNKIWALHDKGCETYRSLDDSECFMDQAGNVHHIDCNQELNRGKRTPRTLKSILKSIFKK